MHRDPLADAATDYIQRMKLSHGFAAQRPGVLHRNAPGRVNILCDLQVEEKTVHLKDIMMYGVDEQPFRGLIRELLGARSEAVAYALEAGFDKLRVSGHRTERSTSAKPGKTIDVTVNIRPGGRS